METKKTPLYNKHIDMNGKMVEFAGYYMPLHYDTTIQEEHENVRKNAGVFDVSHMGEFIIQGPEALRLVQSITCNDASKLKPGAAQYTCMPNDKGGIVDDLILFRLADDKFMLVVNAANIEKDWRWINNHNRYDATILDESDKMGILAVQGPKANDVLQKISGIDTGNIKFYHFAYGDVAGVDDILISATGYTGSGGFELYIPNEHMEAVWDALFEAGKEHNLLPAGLGARDTLRLEMGYCLYGNDIDETTSPIEAGLKWITKFKKEEDYPSKDIFIRQYKEGVSRKLAGFEMEGRRIPRKGYKVLNEAGEEIGEVTSGAYSPSLDIPIGMGYLKTEYTQPGTVIYVDFGRKKQKGQVVKLPFYKG